MSTTTEFPHISPVVLRFLEWTLPQVAERQRRGDGVMGPGRVGAPVGWAEEPGGTVAGVPVTGVPVTGVPVTGVPVTGVPAVGVPAVGEDAAADPADAIRAGVAQAGAHRLMAAAQDRVRRRLVALAGVPLGRAAAGAVASPTGMALSPTGMAGWPAGITGWPARSAESRTRITSSPGPGTAWAVGPPGAPGADAAPPFSQPAPDQAMPPTMRLQGAPSPSHGVRRARPNSDARVAQQQAFSSPEARFLGETPALAPTPGTAWAPGSAGAPGADDAPPFGQPVASGADDAPPFDQPGAPGADAAPPFSQPAPDQAMSPTMRLQGAPSPSHAVRRAEPNSDARVAQLQAFSTPEARFLGETPAPAPTPGTAWARGLAGASGANPAPPFGQPGAPGADSDPTVSQPAPNQAMSPTVRLPGAPSPSHAVRRAEPNGDARFLSAVPDPAPTPGTAWVLGSARAPGADAAPPFGQPGAPGADAAPTFSQPAPNQAMPPTMRLPGAPGPPHRGPQAEPNSGARLAQLQAFSTPEARLHAVTPAPPPHTTPAPHTPNLPAQSRLLAEAQLRQMLADIIRADALRHGLNLKER